MNDTFYSSEIDEYLMQSGMHPDLIDMAWQTDTFRAEMRLGLKDDSSSLPMLPTFLSADGRIPENVPVLVIDAGGTNLRLARVTFRSGGQPEIDLLSSGRMPGCDAPISREEYLLQMVSFLQPHLTGNDLIGYCFSYEAVIRPDHDGVLTGFNKGVRVADSDGMVVCATLEQALIKAGIGGKRSWVLLNDSTAAACGALYKLSGGSYSGTIGFILGTGTNTCYPEKTARMTRYEVPQSAETMLVNMESGAYAGFPRGEADRLLDKNDLLPGNHLYEKIVGGVYIGRLIWLTALSAAQRGLFSEAFRSRIDDRDAFRAVDVDRFVRHPEGDGPLASVCRTDADRLGLLTIVRRLYERAAKLAAVNLTAVLEEAGFGRDPERPALIAAEGSSFWKSALFLPLLRENMDSFTLKTRGISFEITSVPHANLIGSAAAALLNR